MTLTPDDLNPDPINVDDPRLTAYALGELTGAEAAEIETAVNGSQALQQTVASVRETAGLLQKALSEEPMVGLTGAHRNVIEERISESPDLRFDATEMPSLTSTQKVAWLAIGIAASLFMVFSIALPIPTKQGSDCQIVDSGPHGFEPAFPDTRLPANSPDGTNVGNMITPSVSGDEIIITGAAANTRAEAQRRLAGLGYASPGAAFQGFNPTGVVNTDWAQVTLSANQFQNQEGAWVPYYSSESGTSVFFGDGHASFHKTPLSGVDPAEGIFDKMAGGGFGKGGGGIGGGGLALWGANLNDAEGRFQAGWYRFDADGDGIPDAVAVHESTTERYAHIRENAFKLVRREPLSTFSIDVDTASYSNVRRFLSSGQLPPPDAVRIEEFINYFSYDYPQPEGDAPFSINVDVADCPWNRDHRLARIGLQGYEIPNEERPYSNLVFLIDVSGSMDMHNKLPLLKQSMRLLVDELDEYDRVAIVVYAGASGLVLDSTTCDQKEAVIDALQNLQPGGGTNGAAGIELAYQIAADNFIKDGTNRVILATDGDFNVGVTSEVELHQLIEEKAKTGVFLTALGFGGGNYQDANLELLADKGNGNYAYIDTLQEAQKVLVEQMGGTLVTIAKDVKIQVEFNPAVAGAYRLIGYENRMLAKEDFNDDTKDAGEIGAGHTVTALYEIIPAGEPVDFPAVDPLKYQLAEPAPMLVENDELMTVKVRYKRPDEDKSTRLELPVIDQGAGIEEASDDFRFAASVASFGMLLRNSAYRGETDFEQVLDLAENTSGEVRSADREGFVDLVNIAEQLLSRSEGNGDATLSDDPGEARDE